MEKKSQNKGNVLNAKWGVARNYPMRGWQTRELWCLSQNCHDKLRYSHFAAKLLTILQ